MSEQSVPNKPAHDGHVSVRSRLRRSVVRIALVNAVLLGLLMAGLNAVKPLHIDDNQYAIQARYIAQHWGDPYGYSMSGFIWREPGIDVVSPPLIPYWLATCVATVGDSEIALKLWMLPWCVLWAFAAGMLAIRVAPRVCLFVIWLIGLSPWIVPGINLMLDIPSQALAMLSIEMMFWAVEQMRFGNFSPTALVRNRADDSPSAQRGIAREPAGNEADLRRDRFVALGWAAIAGLLATLAIQTKYTGLVCVPLLAVIGVGTGRWREAILAVGFAVSGFVGWEWAMSLKYGVSHFVNVAVLNNTFAQAPATIVWQGMLTQPGVLGLATIALGAWAILPQRWVMLTASILSLGWMAWLYIAPVPMWLYAVTGLVFWITLGVCVARLASVCRWRLLTLTASGFTLDHFLIAWLIIECVLTVGISPFPAARRLMGVLLVATLIAARLIEHRLRNTTVDEDKVASDASQTVFRIAELSAVLGLAFFMADYRDAVAIREAYRDAANAIRAKAPDARIWFLGFWSPKYYGPKFGMQELMLEESRVHRGDYIVFPIAGVFRPEPYFTIDQVREDQIITRGDTLPLQALPGYYGGLLPLVRRNDPTHPRVRLAILNATADFTAFSGVHEAVLKEWIMKRRGVLPVWAVRPLANLVSPNEHELSEKIINTFDASGVEVVARAAGTENPRVRLWAVKRMGERPADRDAWREPLRTAMQDREPIIRAAAAESAKALGLDVAH